MTIAHKLGEVSEEEFERERLNSRKSDWTNLRSRLRSNENENEKEKERESAESRLGRGRGNVEVPESLRKLIGEESVIRGRASAIELAKDFGISESSVSAYAKGSTSTSSYHKPEDTLTKYLSSRKQRITKKSLRVLTSALDTLTPDKLESIKAKDAASIAKDMSVIAKNMEPQTNAEQSSARPQFVIYAPTLRDERSYDTIVVKDDF